MKFTAYIITIALALFSFLGMSASETGVADKAYAEGDYSKAIELYESLMAEKGMSAPLLYNLGNSYYKCGNTDKAVLCYERALRLDPSNSEIRNNLDYIYGRVADSNMAEAKGKNVRTVADEKTFFDSIGEFVSKRHSSNLWGIWAAACFILLVGCVALYIFMSTVWARKIGFFGGIVLACATALFLKFSFSAADNMYRTDEGIITGYKAVLLSEPDAEAKPNSLPLTRGTKVTILSEESEEGSERKWYKVRLNSDYIGWLSNDKLALIEL